VWMSIGLVVGAESRGWASEARRIEARTGGAQATAESAWGPNELVCKKWGLSIGAARGGVRPS